MWTSQYLCSSSAISPSPPSTSPWRAPLTSIFEATSSLATGRLSPSIPWQVLACRVRLMTPQISLCFASRKVEMDLLFCFLDLQTASFLLTLRHFSFSISSLILLRFWLVSNLSFSLAQVRWVSPMAPHWLSIRRALVWINQLSQSRAASTLQAISSYVSTRKTWTKRETLHSRCVPW